MRTKDEMNKLSMAIGEAIRAYHNAISDNLKECGKEMPVLPYDDDDDGMRVEIFGRHDDLLSVVVDKVRYNSEDDSVEFHVCEEDYSDADYWTCPSLFGDAADYIYENIDWEG